MVVAADRVLFLARIKSEGCEVDIAGADESESGLVLLESLELGVHDIELEQLRAIQDVVEVLFAQGNGHLVVPALPARVAAGVHDVGLEVCILAHDSLHLRGSEPHIRVGRLHLVDWVEEAHG